MLHLHLVDAGQVILHRILGRDDLSIRPVQFVQGRVQGCGLARPGRPGHQENPIGAFDDGLEPGVVILGKPKFADANLNIARGPGYA